MGVLMSVIEEGLPPHSNFSVFDIPDLAGKVMMVTGGNRGVGLEIVKVGNPVSRTSTPRS